MKKIWLIALIFLFVGCDGKDKPTPDDNGLGKPTFNAELLFASWNLKKIGMPSSTITFERSTITFKSDGKYYSDGVFGVESGTFIFDSFDGHSLICTNHRNEVKRLTVESISATSLLFTSGKSYDIGNRFQLERLP